MYVYIYIYIYIYIKINIPGRPWAPPTCPWPRTSSPARCWGHSGQNLKSQSIKRKQ